MTPQRPRARAEAHGERVALQASALPGGAERLQWCAARDPAHPVREAPTMKKTALCDCDNASSPAAACRRQAEAGLCQACAWNVEDPTTSRDARKASRGLARTRRRYVPQRHAPTPSVVWMQWGGGRHKPPHRDNATRRGHGTASRRTPKDDERQGREPTEHIGMEVATKQSNEGAKFISMAEPNSNENSDGVPWIAWRLSRTNMRSQR